MIYVDESNFLATKRLVEKRGGTSKKLSFICNVCNRETIISGAAFRKKTRLVCGRCSQRQKLKEHVASHKEEWVDRWKVSMENKYGANNASLVPEIQEKKKETCKKRYGNEYHIASKKVRKKIEKTFNERFGGNSPGCSKEVQEKINKTNKEKYGAIRFIATKEGRKQIEDTCLERYGVPYAGHTEESHKKRQATCQRRWGKDEVMQSDRWRTQRKETMIKKYGVETPIQNEEIKLRILANSTPGRHFKGYLYDNKKFDSSYELAYYIWLQHLGKQFIYHPETPLEYLGSDGKKHWYMPDFLIEGKFYEIKGDMFFNKKGEPYNPYNKKFWWEKYNAMQEAGVEILLHKDMKEAITFVENTRGKRFLKECKKREE